MLSGEELSEPTPRQRQGGLARAEKLTPEERSAIARKAAAARWKRELGAVRFRRDRREPGVGDRLYGAIPCSP